MVVHGAPYTYMGRAPYTSNAQTLYRIVCRVLEAECTRKIARWVPDRARETRLRNAQ